MDQWMARFAPHLQALVALAAHDGHMTNAAQALQIPQSSMSRRIHSLEADLKVPVLIRTGRTVALTAAARDLAERVRPHLHAVELALDEAVGSVDPDTGTVRFGFPLTMGSGRVPDLLSAFRFAHPGITVTLTQATGADLDAGLEAGRLDLAMVIPPPQHRPHRVIGEQRILAALPDNHRLAGTPRIDLAQLKAEVFIANPPSYQLREATERWCSAAGFTPNVAIEVTEFSTIRELISRGLGVGLLPNDPRAPEAMVTVPLAGRHRRTIALATATSTLAPATRRLYDFIIAASG